MPYRARSVSLTHLWQKIRMLTVAETLVLIEAASALMLMWAGLRLLPYSAVRRLRLASAPANPERHEDHGGSATIAWAIRAMAHRLPGTMTCLVQALAAQVMLRRRGFRSDLRIGVSGKDRMGMIKAHAWVECDGRVIVGEVDDLARYAVLTAPASQ